MAYQPSVDNEVRHLTAALMAEAALENDEGMAGVADVLNNRRIGLNARPGDYGTSTLAPMTTFAGQFASYSGGTPQFSSYDRDQSIREGGGSAAANNNYLNAIRSGRDGFSGAGQARYDRAEAIARSFVDPESRDYGRWNGISGGADYFQTQSVNNDKTKRPDIWDRQVLGTQAFFRRHTLGGLQPWDNPRNRVGFDPNNPLNDSRVPDARGTGIGPGDIAAGFDDSFAGSASQFTPGSFDKVNNPSRSIQGGVPLPPERPADVDYQPNLLDRGSDALTRGLETGFGAIGDAAKGAGAAISGFFNPSPVNGAAAGTAGVGANGAGSGAATIDYRQSIDPNAPFTAYGVSDGVLKGGFGTGIMAAPGLVADASGTSGAGAGGAGFGAADVGRFGANGTAAPGAGAGFNGTGSASIDMRQPIDPSASFSGLAVAGNVNKGYLGSDVVRPIDVGGQFSGLNPSQGIAQGGFGDGITAAPGLRADAFAGAGAGAGGFGAGAGNFGAGADASASAGVGGAFNGGGKATFAAPQSIDPNGAFSGIDTSGNQPFGNIRNPIALPQSQDAGLVPPGRVAGDSLPGLSPLAPASDLTAIAGPKGFGSPIQNLGMGPTLPPDLDLG